MKGPTGSRAVRGAIVARVDRRRALATVALIGWATALACGPSGVIGYVGEGAGETAVPPPLRGLPELTNVAAVAGDDGVLVTFDPIDDAKDYRIYPLPAPGDVSAGSDGAIVIKDAIYRCAGDRETWAAPANVDPEPQGWSVHTSFEADEDANTLGYVFPSAGEGRAPVYAIAGHASEGEEGWRESRLKVYTTDAAERASLLASRAIGANGVDLWRDDGVAFYVPATSGASTRAVYTSEESVIVAGQGWRHYTRHYFGPSELDARKADDPLAPRVAWNALAAPAPGAVPLLRVGYTGVQDHDELAAGRERFRRAATQGNRPLWALAWSGLTAPTTLVVEALDQGCPFQGFLAPAHLDASYDDTGAPRHQAFLTLDELRAASATGEVFVNGQHEADNHPRAVARSFVAATPAPHDPALAWFAGFSDARPLAPLTALPVGDCGGMACGHLRSDDFDFSYYNLDFGLSADGSKRWPVLTYGQFLGQFWVAYDDAGSGVTGKVRLTPRAKATMSGDPTAFVRVTMAADMVTTDSRYPQIFVSDLEAPIQDAYLACGRGEGCTGHSVLVQPRGGPDARVELQVFDAFAWDADNTPSTTLALTDGATVTPSADPPFEHAGVDRPARFDVYVSTARVYVLLDGEPAGCADLPAGAGPPAGPVTVTFGDVLFHEGAEGVGDVDSPLSFHRAHQYTETKRHFDDLGFASGAPAPEWDGA